MPIRIVVAGCTGWVGRALVPAILAADGLRLVAAVSRSAAGKDVGKAAGGASCGVKISATLDQALRVPSDVLIDYTNPDTVKAHVLLALERGRHVVVGTSGLGAADYADIGTIAKLAERGVIAAGNFSITATLLRRFALEAARHVADIEIIDYASASKPDTPSGTARELAEALAERRRPPTALPPGELSGIPETRGAAVGEPVPVQVHSIRMPSFLLSCEAIFGAPDERLTIRHDSGESAAPYVAGTLLAAHKVVGRTGLTRGLDSLLD